jgi:hypothetical protein
MVVVGIKIVEHYSHVTFKARKVGHGPLEERLCVLRRGWHGFAVSAATAARSHGTRRAGLAQQGVRRESAWQRWQRPFGAAERLHRDS